MKEKLDPSKTILYSESKSQFAFSLESPVGPVGVAVDVWAESSI